MLVHYLVDSEPDAVVVVVEGDYVVDEGFGLRVVLRRVERLMQHLLHQLEVRLRVEGGVEGQEGSRELQAVPRQLEFVQRVDILYRELDARALRRLHDPEEEVGLLPRLQVDAVVARTLVTQLVDVVLRYLPLDLVLLLGVRHQVKDVVHEVAEAGVDSAGTENQGPLSVLPLFRGRVLITEGPQLVLIVLHLAWDSLDRGFLNWLRVRSILVVVAAG